MRGRGSPASAAASRGDHLVRVRVRTEPSAGAKKAPESLDTELRRQRGDSGADRNTAGQDGERSIFDRLFS